MHSPRIARALILVLVLACGLHAWEWQWINPHPTGHNLVHAFFSDTLRGIVVADNGEVAETGDAGVTWKLRRAGTASILISAASTRDGKDILGAGPQGIWKSGDGGLSWRRTASFPENFFDVCQAGPEMALAAGTAGTIARSQDGGESWQAMQLDTPAPALLGLDCGRNGMAAAVGQAGFIVTSVDGGKTWRRLPAPVPGALAGVAFADSLRGFAAGENGQVLDTRDGGNTWWQRTLDTTSFFRKIRVEGSRLTVLGSEGGIWKSADGGTGWSKCETGTENDLNHSAPAGQEVEIATGNAGMILRSADGGKTWSNRRKGRDWGLTGVVALSASTWVGFGDNGLVLRTSDGGASWKEWSSPGGLGLLAGGYWGRRGVLAGYQGTLLRSENGGETWLEITDRPTSRGLGGVAWFDSMTVVAVGDSGTLLRSVDGGARWKALTGIPGVNNQILSAVKTLSGGRGIAVGYRGLIMSTADMGNTWTAQGGSNTVNLYSLSFLDDSTGMVVGTRGTVLATRDGGQTWIPYATGFEDELRGITLINRDSALVAGELFFRPILRITGDGGRTWSEVSGPSYKPYIGLVSLAPGKILAVAGDGTLLTADLGSGPAALPRRSKTDRPRNGIWARRLGASTLITVNLALPNPGQVTLTAHATSGKMLQMVFRRTLSAGIQVLTVPLVVKSGPVFLRMSLHGAQGRSRNWVCRLLD